MTLTLRDLTHPDGVQQIIDVTGGTRSFYNHPERAQGLATVAAQAIMRNPALGSVKVRPAAYLPNAFYDYRKGEIILGIVNPAVLAHEIEHADNLRQQGMYTGLLRIADGVARLNNVLAVPTVLALKAFLRDPEQRDDVLKTLSAISAAAAAPTLVEESAATARALAHNPGQRAELLRTLTPAYLQHLAHGLKPALVYQAGRSL